MLGLLLLGLLGSHSAEQHEYCPTEEFRARCGHDEIILLQTAMYGRMKIGRCVQTDYGNVGCQADVLRFTDRRCSGRHRCEIRIPDAVFETTMPCPIEFKSYFLTSYECVKVAIPHRQGCPTTDHVTLTGTSGYLANVITEETSYGSLTCPWRILLPRGQRINITLLDFATPNEDASSFGLMDSGICYQYAIVSEKTSNPRNIKVCGGQNRERTIYTSRTNSVEVRIITRNNVESDKIYHFALKWEALGCPEVTAPHLGWQRYSADAMTIVMGCNTSGKQWTLMCDKNKWIGQMENCADVEPDHVGMQWGSISLPYSVSVGVIVGLALIVGVIILLVGLILMEWRKMKRHNAAETRRNIAITAAINDHNEDTNKDHYINNYGTSKTNTPKQNNLVKQGEQQNNHQNHDKGSKESNDYSYMKEVWPMAPPPGLVSGTSTYPRSASKNNYGSTGQGTMGRPRSTGHNELEEQRHIYDSPKTMRKLDNGPRYFELSRGKQYREDSEDIDTDDQRHS